MSQPWFRNFIIAVLSNRFIKLVGGIIALFLAFGLLVDWVFMPIYTRHGQALEVPNVVAKRYEEAKSTLEGEGFEVIKQERIDAKYQAGYVVEQIPRPHASVKGGRPIYIVVSQGARKVPMPKLVEGSVRDAQLSLARYNLVLGRVDSAYSTEPLGVVIAQSVPYFSRTASGKDSLVQVGIGTVVNITVSLGDASTDVTVPSVAGLTYDAARELIAKAGLIVGQITFKEIDSLLPETVINQSLEANTLVRRGSKIDLEVSQLPSSSSDNQP